MMETPPISPARPPIGEAHRRYKPLTVLSNLRGFVRFVALAAAKPVHRVRVFLHPVLGEQPQYRLGPYLLLSVAVEALRPAVPIDDQAIHRVPDDCVLGSVNQFGQPANR